MGIITFFSQNTHAYDELTPKQKSDVINKIFDQDIDWEKASVSGKFRMRGLPLSPTVKIFMIKDSLTIISLRAPFVGEVGRGEITSDSIMMVNKRNKVYFKESIGEFLKAYPLEIGQLQKLLLGIPFFPGVADESLSDMDWMEIYGQAEEYAFIPGEKGQLDICDYGELIDSEGRLKILAIVPMTENEINVSLEYYYLPKGYNIHFSYLSTGPFYEADLELDQPKFEEGDMTPMDISNKYRRVSATDFFKAFYV